VSPELVLINGRASVAVSALDRGLHFGDGLFETIGCVDGAPRFLELHLERLASGCARLGLAAPESGALEAEVRRLAGESARSIIKVLLTRGAALARGYAPSGAEPPTRVTLRYAWPEEDGSLAHEGVRVRVARTRLGENPVLAGIKHCNRLEQVLARAEWTDPTIAEALLYSSSGALISGTMSNVFLVRDGTLCTPRLDRCGVAGIMRRVVLAAAAQAGIAAEERTLGSRDLAAAGEVFLTNALMGVRPVRELEGRALSVGAVTRAVQERLAPLLRGASRPSAERSDG
jgi:4-amino-4-deoxychorismate lyase